MSKINKPAKLCTRFGLQWEGFKVPKGAIFGVCDDVPFVATRVLAYQHNNKVIIPQKKAVVWLKIQKTWTKYICCPQESVQAQINYDLLINSSKQFIELQSKVASRVFSKLREDSTSIINFEEYRNPKSAFKNPTHSKNIEKANILPRLKQAPKPLPYSSMGRSRDGYVDSHGITVWTPDKISDSKTSPEPYWATFNKEATRRYVQSPI